MKTNLKLNSKYFVTLYNTFKDCLTTLKYIEDMRHRLNIALKDNFRLVFYSNNLKVNFDFVADEWGYLISSRSSNIDELYEELRNLEDKVIEKILNAFNIESINIRQDEYSPDIIDFLSEHFEVNFE